MTFLKSLFKKREPDASLQQPPPPALAIEETVDGFFDKPIPKAERYRAAMLTRFLKPNAIHARTARDAWEESLTQPYADVISRFLTAGDLRTLSISESLECARVAELKAALKTADLRTSGNKSDLIQRLVEAAPSLAASLAQQTGADAYCVTDAGCARAAAYIAERDWRLQQAIAASFQCLQQHQARQACTAINRYYAWLPEPLQPGMGIDYTSGGVNPYSARATAVLDHAPSSWVLAEIPPARRETFILAAAATSLWPESKPVLQALGITDAPDLPRPAEVHIRMLESIGHSVVAIAEAKRSGMELQIGTANDQYVCAHCASSAKRTYDPQHAPLLPHRECTSVLGCRCWYV